MQKCILFFCFQKRKTHEGLWIYTHEFVLVQKSLPIDRVHGQNRPPSRSGRTDYGKNFMVPSNSAYLEVPIYEI